MAIGLGRKPLTLITDGAQNYRDSFRREFYTNHKPQSIYHNFIKPHEGLQGRTPAEVAGIRVEGEDRWKTLIQNAKVQEMQSKKHDA